MLDETTNDDAKIADVLPIWAYRKSMDTEPLAQMRRHWTMLKAGKTVPLRADIDPRAIAGSLQNGFVVERTEPGMVRFRLAGLALCELMGMEVRGMPLRAFIAPAARADFAAQLDRIFETPEIHEYAMISDGENGHPLTAKMLILPLQSEGGAINRAIGCLVTDGETGLSPRRFRVVETHITSTQTGFHEKQVSQSEMLRVAHSSGTGEKTTAQLTQPRLRLVKTDI